MSGLGVGIACFPTVGGSGVAADTVVPDVLEVDGRSPLSGGTSANVNAAAAPAAASATRVLPRLGALIEPVVMWCMTR